MIDFIKAVIKECPPLDLEFTRAVAERTGELASYKVAEIDNLKIRVYDSGRTLLTGSLHKFANAGEHNANDFTISDLMQVCEQLKSIGIQPEKSALENIEIGVNITPPAPTKEILNRLMVHKRVLFKWYSIPGASYKQAPHSHYVVKVYDKAKQYNLPLPLLRFELKYLKMAEINSLGLFTLADVAKPTVWQCFGKLLIKRWNECVLPMSIDSPYTDPIFWEGLATKHRNSYNYHFKKIVHFDRLSGNETKAKISDAIRQKLCILTDFGEPSAGTPFVQIDRSYIVSDCTNSKLCPVTGLDISMQKEQSKFLSVAGLRFYKQNQPEKFSELYKKYLRRSRFTKADPGTQLRELAHAIRNAYFNRFNNPRNNAIRDIKKILNNPTMPLFDNLQFIKKEKLKYYKSISN